MLKFYTRFCFSASKIITNPREVLAQIPNGAIILCGGFGICGIPENSIGYLRELGTKDLTVVSNTCGIESWGLGILLKSRQVKRMVSSYVGENKEFERQYLGGDLEVELVPQGTLAEKCRAGGAGIPAFYTATGVGTMVEHGGLPIKFKPGGKEILWPSPPKETKVFNGRKYVMEESIYGDYALIKAYKSDRKGNLIFRKTSKNFNMDMVGAAKVVIAEVEEIVENGELQPDEIHAPGVYVDYVYKGDKFEKRFEKLVYDPAYGGGQKLKNFDLRGVILDRACKEVKHGMYVNLGIGIPTMLPAFIPKDVVIELHSENGILGIGNYPKPGEEDADLINAGKETITFIPGSSTFSSSTSFGIIRGGHLDLTILGAMQISRKCDIANWIIPGKLVKGMGGAMDLVSSGSKVIVLTEHTDKYGKPKLLEQCSLPITGENKVDMVITERAVFERRNDELVLTEIQKDWSLDQIKDSTGFQFKQTDVLKQF